MSRLSAVEAVRGLVRCLENMGCDDDCGLSAETTNPDAHEPHCPRGAALRALADFQSRAPLRDDAELAEQWENEGFGLGFASAADIFDRALLGATDTKGDRDGE